MGREVAVLGSRSTRERALGSSAPFAPGTLLRDCCATGSEALPKRIVSRPCLVKAEEIVRSIDGRWCVRGVVVRHPAKKPMGRDSAGD
jgi:hypothetical protein